MGSETYDVTILVKQEDEESVRMECDDESYRCEADSMYYESVYNFGMCLDALRGKGIDYVVYVRDHECHYAEVFVGGEHVDVTIDDDSTPVAKILSDGSIRASDVEQAKKFYTLEKIIEKAAKISRMTPLEQIVYVTEGAARDS